LCRISAILKQPKRYGTFGFRADGKARYEDANTHQLAPFKRFSLNVSIKDGTVDKQSATTDAEDAQAVPTKRRDPTSRNSRRRLTIDQSDVENFRSVEEEVATSATEPARDSSKSRENGRSSRRHSIDHAEVLRRMNDQSTPKPTSNSNPEDLDESDIPFMSVEDEAKVKELIYQYVDELQDRESFVSSNCMKIARELRIVSAYSIGPTEPVPDVAKLDKSARKKYKQVMILLPRPLPSQIYVQLKISDCKSSFITSIY
jgi:hypothetical protein